MLEVVQKALFIYFCLKDNFNKLPQVDLNNQNLIYTSKALPLGIGDDVVTRFQRYLNNLYFEHFHFFVSETESKSMHI